jgi:hypothetical protein
VRPVVLLTNAIDPECGWHPVASSWSIRLGRIRSCTSLRRKSFLVTDGGLELPERPGLGVTIDPGFVER